MATSADPGKTPATKERDPRPVVALPRQGLPGAVIAGFGALLALVLFFVLDSQRRHPQVTPRPEGARGAAFAPPPPLTIPPEPALPAPPTAATIVTSPLPQAPAFRPQPVVPPTPIYTPPIIVPAPVATPEPVSTEQPALRNTSPALIYDAGAEGTGTQPAGSNAPAPGAAQGGQNRTQLGDDTPVRASVIRNQAMIMPVGTLIPAVLETPIDTARPGLVRAVVSRDARGFDGSRVLVPRGSRLIGEYQADVRSGQDRVLVTWARLIRPDGVAIRLGSPAADRLGGAGVPGRVNTFFFQRFAAAVLQSALTIGVNIASRPRSGSVVVGIPSGQLGNTIGQGLLPGNDLRPKITVKQGAALNVFVARDLDFSGTGRPQ